QPQMVVIDGDLTDGTRKRYRKLARGVEVAEENVGNGIAAFRAGEPGLQDGIRIFLFPTQAERATIHQHQDQRLAGLLQCLEQTALAGREIETGATGGLM